MTRYSGTSKAFLYARKRLVLGYSSVTIWSAAQHPRLGDVEFELRCGICLRGLCVEAQVLKGKNRGIYGVFVPPCPFCEKDIILGKTVEERKRWSTRQLDAVEDGDYSGMEWWD